MRLTVKHVRRAMGALILLAAIVWLADDLLLRRRIAQGGGYNQVEVHQRYAVALKNKQVEYRSVKPYMQECVASLFPHQNEYPCWYLQKYSDRIDDIDSGPWHFWY